jgi:hypothetical protein
MPSRRPGDRVPTRATPADLLLGVVLVAAALWWWSPWAVGRTAAVARVTVGGSAAGTLSLDRPGVHRYRGALGETAVEVERGRVRIAASACPNQLCVKAGWRGAPGSAVVCLPNRVAVILDGRAAGVDAVSR